MKKINENWHKQHVMGKNPTMPVRIKWHLAHAKACGCRDIPKTVKAAIAKRG